ncbi:FHA domain-containing protein [Streptomyces acidicola]|uniref:FHA domain-containing protein n=1 Tax=Streptomyces acidicola TaxID=2596892 RepID=UPI00344AC9E2
MQIRLTVVDPLGPSSEPRGRATACDVLVTAPSGTALAAVASGLASAVGGDGGASQPDRGREQHGGGAIVLYADGERLDAQRCTLGEPPLVDGAVLSLGAPEPGPEVDESAPRLHVVAGPDAGGVHFLHGGRIDIGRSADADVPLDDPDVSRLHCAVTVAEDGRVSVADIGSTNGTTLDGIRVGDRPVRLTPGALLRIGESALRLTPPGGIGAGSGALSTAPDGEGHVRVVAGGAAAGDGGPLVPGQAEAPLIESRDIRGGGAAEAEAQTGHGSTTYPGHSTHPDPRSAAPEGPASPGRAAVPGSPAALGSSTGTRASEGQAPAPADGDPGPGGTRKGTPVRGMDLPRESRKRGGLSAWARRLTGGRGEQPDGDLDPYDTDDDFIPESHVMVAQAPEKWPDPAALLLTALGPGSRLWERGPEHPEALTVRLGTADRAAPGGSGLLPSVPVTAGLREVGALGLAGPRARLLGLARAVVAQLAALHSPDALELVLISADRSRSEQERAADWSWLGWLPHVRPGHGQDCRLLLAYDHDQAAARTDELLRRLADHTADPELSADDAPGKRPVSPPSWARDGDSADAGFAGPYTVVIVDGDPGGAEVRKAVARLAAQGPAAGIHVVCLAETEAASPSSPVSETYEAACEVSPAFRACGAVALLSGDVATALRLMRVAPARSTGHTTGDTTWRTPPESRQPHARAGDPSSHTPTRTSGQAPPAASNRTHVSLVGHLPDDAGHDRGNRSDWATLGSTTGAPSLSGPITPGTVAAVDAVSAAWAERFARALAPLRPDGAIGERHARVSAPLPQSARLLDELGLARATPASLMTRWADAADDAQTVGGRAWAVLGAGPRGPVSADLAADGPHLLIEGPPGSGRTELLRSIAASLSAAERPDRLGIALVDGRDGSDHGTGPGDGLGVCTDLPHVGTHLAAHDPVRMREFAQSLSAELKRRSELLGRLDFIAWHTGRGTSGRVVAQRSARGGASADGGSSATSPRASSSPTSPRAASPTTLGASPGAADLDTPPSSTLRLRPSASRDRTDPGPPLARLVVIVDDLDALLSPPLGSPGRPSAGSVVRALEAVAREGARLGVHLVAATSGGLRTAETDLARAATLHIALEAPAPGPDEPAPGRGRLTIRDTLPTGHPAPDRAIPFQAGRVTGRIPRTATLRPTVVPLDWTRMGDPPARRPVRELGNGPTDLALLASALDRAAREVSATEVPSLL